MQKRLASLLLAFAFLLCSKLLAYNPPIGIPNPGAAFGWEIDRTTPAWPSSWKASPTTETANCYYVDNTDARATDTSNPFGHPDKPRRTFPDLASYPAGTFVYCHAGTYAGQIDWRGVGTSALPIWITGNPEDRPVLTGLTHIGRGATGRSSHIVIENFHYSGSGASIQVRPTIDGQNLDHVLIRNVKVQQAGATADIGGILIGLSSSSDGTPNTTVSDVVVYNCDISYCGVRSGPYATDSAGVYNGFHTNRVWVLDNLIHHVGADSVAGSHYSNYTTLLTENYFIGRNTMYGNGENGIDLKNVQGFVISQNTIYGPFEREQGGGIVLHYGARSEFHPRNGAVIFNNVYRCTSALATGLSSGVDNLDVIGNTFWDIHAKYAATADPMNGACIQLGGTTTGANSVFRIVNNTFHDYDRGIMLAPNVGDSFRLHGNIFSARSNASLYELEVSSGREAAVNLDYNLYTGTPAFLWAGAARSLSYMKSTAGQESHGQTGDPMFAEATAGNLRLRSGSPAVDSAVEGPAGDSAYTYFRTRWGLDIKRDFDGRPRPIDSGWDIGAFEAALPPLAPSALQVTP